MAEEGDLAKFLKDGKKFSDALGENISESIPKQTQPGLFQHLMKVLQVSAGEHAAIAESLVVLIGGTFNLVDGKVQGYLSRALIRLAENFTCLIVFNEVELACPEEWNAVEAIFTKAKQRLEMAQTSMKKIRELMSTVANQAVASPEQRNQFKLLFRDVAAAYEACLVGMDVSKIKIDRAIARMKKEQACRTALALSVLTAAGVASGGMAFMVEGAMLSAGLTVVSVGCGVGAVHQVKIAMDQFAKIGKLKSKAEESLHLMTPDLVELRTKLKSAAIFMEITSVSMELPRSTAAWQKTITGMEAA